LLSIYLSIIIYSAAYFDTDSDSESESDEIYHNDRHNLENDEAYDGDDEADYLQISIILDDIINTLHEYEEDSNSDEEDGHRNEDTYHRSQELSSGGNNNTTN